MCRHRLRYILLIYQTAIKSFIHLELPAPIGSTKVSSSLCPCPLVTFLPFHHHNTRWTTNLQYIFIILKQFANQPHQSLLTGWWGREQWPTPRLGPACGSCGACGGDQPITRELGRRNERRGKARWDVGCKGSETKHSRPKHVQEKKRGFMTASRENDTENSNHPKNRHCKSLLSLEQRVWFAC